MNEQPDCGRCYTPDDAARMCGEAVCAQVDEPEHTPTPWDVIYGCCIVPAGESGNHKGLIAKITGGLSRVELDNANAALIVRAVNAFEPLMEACQSLTDLATKHARCFGQEASVRAFLTDPATSKAFQQARAALALARGE